MSATRDIGMNRSGLAAVAAARPGAVSHFDVLDFGAPLYFPKPRWMDVPGGRPAAGLRGLDRAERKAPVRTRAIGAAIDNTRSLAALWVGIPFAAVFLLGFVTLV